VHCFNCLWLNYLTLCKGLGLGLGLEVQSLGLGLDQKGLVLILVLVLGNFWSLGLGLGLEEKVLFTSLVSVDRILSVALVYCGKTVGWIMMSLRNGGRPWPRPHCVRWRPSFPPQKGGIVPNFRPMSVVAK